MNDFPCCDREEHDPPPLFREEFRFEWAKPPLSLNYRMHRMAEAKVVKDLRAQMRARARNVPDMERCQVELIWYVTTRGRRDDENPVPTLKALCEGLVDAEVVPDDTHQYMVKLMPRIEWIDKKKDAAHMVLVLTELEDQS